MNQHINNGAEHWVVIRGTAKVQRGDEQIVLSENESIYIPLGIRHRLENPGRIELELIEVQSGSYPGEDDIVRFHDHYGRSDAVPAAGRGLQPKAPQIHADTLELAELLRFAPKDKNGEALHGTSQRGREYGKLVTGLMQFIPDLQGFYLWGRYENDGLWRTIYLGKAGFGRTASLRARITEELKDERSLIWCGKHTGLDDKAVKQLWHLPYPPSPDNKAGINHANRALRKAGSTHIIWVATPEIDNGDVARIEADLIETLNPSANVQRPAPSSGLQEATVSVVQQLKVEIHRHRPKRKTSKIGMAQPLAIDALPTRNPHCTGDPAP